MLTGAAEIWEPLFALGDLAGSDWPHKARQAAVSLTTGGPEEVAIGALFFDILVCFLSNDQERLFSRTMTRDSKQFDEAI